jgi:hypothetical protein
LEKYEGVFKSFRTEPNNLRSDEKGYGGKTHYTDSQSSNTTALSGTELYYLQFPLQAAIPENFGYTLVESGDGNFADLMKICHEGNG